MYNHNRKYIFSSALLLILSVTAVAQSTITGMVASTDHEPLIGATVMKLGSTAGTVTDINGKFSIDAQAADLLIISFVGFETDTVKVIKGRPMHVKLNPDTQQLAEVVVKSETSMFDALKPMHNEVLLESELTKAACCNLSESFETNASVDVSFTDAVSGTKIIQMLGLDGRYVQINRENIPLVRGLTGRYGLGYVPGTWLQSIDVGKGAGTVVNGYESMSGQINLEFKKPEISETLYLNAYQNSFGRSELNLNTATNLNEKWSMAILSHADYMNVEIDKNDDGFMDLPKSTQLNILQRFKYEGDRVKAQVGYNIMTDKKAGGQLGFDLGENSQNSSEYGFSNHTRKFEVFGKTGVLFPETPYQGFGFIYSASFQSVDAGFGRNLYEGEETTLYGNVIYQNILGSSFHQYKTGASILYDDFNEVFTDSAFSRKEVVPGAYFEYSYLPGENFSLVAGVRVDEHNLYGTYFTPRLHTRYVLSPTTTLRLAVGRGYRTPNAITENTKVLVSSRQLIIEEEIRPEVSWNMGGSLVWTPEIAEKEFQFITDYFYTTFENQMIVDQDRSSTQVSLYNLDGDSYAHSLQIEGSVKLNAFVNVKGAYKFYNVKTTINGRLMDAPYIPRNRFFVNASYATKFDKWTADLTFNWIGRKRLPDTSDKPTELQRASFSPDFILMNGQVSRGFKWGNIYLGSENLLNFKQNNPIIDAENPFGNDFDASIVWGPVPGRLIYMGVRYKIKRKK